MSDAQRRAVRTLLQVSAVQILLQTYNAFAPNPLTNEQYVALTALGSMLVTFGQAWLEDNTRFPALLKAPTSPGQNPIPEPDRPLEQPPRP